MHNELFFDQKVNENISDMLDEERKSIGFYDLCDVDVQPYLDFAANVRQKDIVIIGIGGSALGSSAIYEFLNYGREFDKKLHIFDTTDPLLLKRKLSNINLDDAFFCLISKSGGTVETIAVYKYIASLVEMSGDNCVTITDEGSNLEQYSKTNGIRSFFIPGNVGGRFSVLSAVGLLPLAMLGVDIKVLLEGAQTIRNSFFEHDEYCSTLLKKATFYATYANTYNINCLFSYSEAFREFNAWYVQLWGESLGKKQLHSELHVGLTPIGLIGPTDQHSFLQLIMEGKFDKSVTFIKIKNFDNELKVPDVTMEALEELDNINGLKFSKLINMQADSIIESLENNPLDIIEIEQVDERAMGELIMYFELLTALVAKMLDINAYDQPGVEMGKIILKEKLKNLD